MSILSIILAIIMAILGINPSVQTSRTETATDVIAEPVAEAEVYADELVMQQLLSAIGTENIEKAKAENISLSVDISCYGNGDGSADELRISVEIRSYYETTWPENIVNWELMRDIQFAVIDSGIFDLTEDDVAALKASCYSPDSSYADFTLENGINLHINETPSYEAIVYIRQTDTESAAGALQWNSRYKWDELVYRY